MVIFIFPKTLSALKFFKLLTGNGHTNTILFSDVHHNDSIFEDIQYSVFQNDRNKPFKTKSQDHKLKKKITKFFLVMRTFKFYSLSSFQICKLSPYYTVKFHGLLIS